jgi:oxygen-independent coproporphyrinogen-3 oxidase
MASPKPTTQIAETLGVYIQIPFCASKCSFCNFSSQVARADVLESYSRALEEEIRNLPLLYDRQGIDAEILKLTVDSIYLGGGTPTLLGSARVGRLLECLRECCRIGPAPEFTLESTPGSADEGFLRQARALGVNRLSIGAQSFDDRELRAVGRLHTAQQTRELVFQARDAGFSNISLDLIAGLPYQTDESWHKSLEAAAVLAPEHVSVYLLEVDEKSRLGGEVLRHGTRYHADQVPGEEFMVAAYEFAREFLREHGYVHYEISNFALPGRQSLHNQKYWQWKPYIGLGAGAHSFDGERRWVNEQAPEVYRKKVTAGESPIAEMRTLRAEEQIEEFFLVGLRQSAGVNLSWARRRWGDRVSPWESKVDELERVGWLERCTDQVRLTSRAYLVSNEILQEFLIVQ